MTNKVYTGTTSIKEHIKQLGMSGWMPHKERKQKGTQIKQPVKQQSFEIRRLKLEAGLISGEENVRGGGKFE